MQRKYEGPYGYGYNRMNLGAGKEECCGTCWWHKKKREDPDWSCDNPESERYGEYTGYKEWCEEHEKRRTTR